MSPDPRSKEAHRSGSMAEAGKIPRATVQMTKGDDLMAQDACLMIDAK